MTFLLIIVLALTTNCAKAQTTEQGNIDKKIDQSNLNALSQSQLNKKLKSDAEDENLEGRVKSVLEFVEEPTGSERRPLSEDYYNEQGNLLKNVLYLDGSPIEIRLFGYIDDERVSDVMPGCSIRNSAPLRK